MPLTSSAVRNQGAWFDPELTMNTHVNKLCSAAYFHLYNLSRIRKYLTQQKCEQLMHAFVTSRIDYCNSLLYGLPAKQLNKIIVMTGCDALVHFPIRGDAYLDKVFTNRPDLFAKSIPYFVPIKTDRTASRNEIKADQTNRLH